MCGGDGLVSAERITDISADTGLSDSTSLRTSRPASTATAENTAREQSAQLMRRAPSGYLWNQAFSFWQFLSLFLFNLVLVRLLSIGEYGAYQIALTASTTAIYIAAVGLESSGSVYLPRVFAEEGPGQAMTVALRLLGFRLGMVLLVAGGTLWGLPAIAALAARAQIPSAAVIAQALNDPTLLQHRSALALYVAATSLASLLSALLTALLRTRIIFLAGSLAQIATIGLAYVLTRQWHAGADGALVALAVPTGATALIYLFALLRVLGARPRRLVQPINGPVLRLGIAAWASDLANGSLLKAIGLAQLGLLAVTVTTTAHNAAYFGITYEMGHAAGLIFVAGLGGVGLAVMAVAYASANRDSLATAWRAVSKLQIVLAVPLVAFCVPHAEAIMEALYKSRYADTGGLLALFLGFNALVRLCGGGSNSAALYVLGRQRWVVITSWGMLGVLALCDVLFIPAWGVAGALLAVGVAQLAAEVAQLVLARYFLKRAYPVGFVLRVLLALLPAMVFTVLWRPTSLPALFVAGLGFAVLFIVALRLIRPLDDEDRALLAEASPRLRTLLLPFTRPATGAAVPTSTTDSASTPSQPTPAPALARVTRPLSLDADE